MVIWQVKGDFTLVNVLHTVKFSKHQLIVLVNLTVFSQNQTIEVWHIKPSLSLAIQPLIVFVFCNYRIRFALIADGNVFDKIVLKSGVEQVVAFAVSNEYEKTNGRNIPNDIIAIFTVACRKETYGQHHNNRFF